eukprot:CAMPEP_0171102442 /NCGR_PEP_ID=MMETSP0766_2-20121228/57834_1 /TAXON_ID=439317 /ORGANISM="Gambierdiscus australes, Strain CAWD 149" /LENGTH=78 /DNA_ID=CAMNT_0011562735 /DNA_START=57 /DNA_END=293 /DNA_ORIENTATION=-
MEGLDEAQKKVLLAAQGAKNLTEVVGWFRGKNNFAKEVAMAYKLKAAGRFEEAPLSVEAIMKKEFPDGVMPKPFGSTI